MRSAARSPAHAQPPSCVYVRAGGHRQGFRVQVQGGTGRGLGCKCRGAQAGVWGASAGGHRQGFRVQVGATSIPAPSATPLPPTSPSHQPSDPPPSSAPPPSPHLNAKNALGLSHLGPARAAARSGEPAPAPPPPPAAASGVMKKSSRPTGRREERRRATAAMAARGWLRTGTSPAAEQRHKVVGTTLWSRVHEPQSKVFLPFAN